MTDDQQRVEHEKKATRRNAQGLLRNIQFFFHERLSIRDLATPRETIEGISKDVEFKGFNVWILISAIFIASIGLNVNSTAVIIGAMLISPLMGPIMGMGMAIGINDLPLLTKSLRNLGVAVAIAISTSALYFLITPLSDASSELLARTQPTILDVFVAFFGGVSGILAGSRKEKSNVIPGVAIATALMPPLCTAGYGLATLQLNYFLGAFYLFTINGVFISIAAYLVVRYLKFPLSKYQNEAQEKKVKRLLSIALTAVSVPSLIIFYFVVTNAIYDRNANLFITEKLHYEGAEVVKSEILRSDSVNTINVVFFGKEIPAEVIRGWQKDLQATGLDNTKLQILQGSGNGQNDLARMAEVYSTGQAALVAKDREILELRNEVKSLSKSKVPDHLIEEIKTNYPNLESIRTGEFYCKTETNPTDTVMGVLINWYDIMSKEQMNASEKKLQQWLKLRLDRDTVWIMRMEQ